MKQEFKELLKLRIAENIHSTTPRTVIVYPTKNEISYREIHKIYTDENEAYKIYQKCRKYYDIVFIEMIFNEKEFVKNSHTIPNLINCNTVTVKTLYINRNNRKSFKSYENKIITKPKNQKKKTNNSREDNDFYPTPAFVVEELLKRENFEGDIWEPACGRGDISEVLIDKGYDVLSTDLIDRGYGSKMDFLKPNSIRATNIITNPPFKYGLEFVEQAKKHCDGKIAMFLKTTFLESQKRLPMFLDKEFRLKTIYQFSDRVSLYKNGVKTENPGKNAHAWYVWDKKYKGNPEVKWIE